MPKLAKKTKTAPAFAPQAPRLPVPTAGDLDETQWAVILALLDAVVPSIVPADTEAGSGPGTAVAVNHQDNYDFDRTSKVRLSRTDYDAVVARVRSAIADPPSPDLVAAYLADRPSDNPEFVYSLRRTVAAQTPAMRQQLGGLLTALSGRAGALALTGRCTPVHRQPVHVREAILHAWGRSWIPALRKVHRSMYALAQTAWLMSSPLFRQAAGYLEAPPHWQPGPDQAFDFLQFGGESEKEEALVDTDVVIVGSGCGGAVCAQVLAAAGHRVVVVDKGYHFPESQLPMPQEAGARLLYENGAVLASTSPSIGVVAGSCWGGGGKINWSVALRTPDVVRQEWASGGSDAHDSGSDGNTGLDFFMSPAFDACLDRVCDFMQVNQKPETAKASHSSSSDGQSHRGRVVLDGAARLGFEAAPLLQNTRGGRPHDDGYCHMGCASGEKRGTSTQWLPAAAQDGAQFIEGFQVDRVLFNGEAGTNKTSGNKNNNKLPTATGVIGTWRSRDAGGGVTGPDEERQTRRVVIRAKRVIVSCGSLWSPMVLLNSGLKNPQIGKNLHLHPCNMVGAYFDEETKPMDHGIITSICTSFTDLDGHGHGPRLEPTCMLPYTALCNLPWRGGLDFKLAALRFRHLDTFIALTRDRDTGRVFPEAKVGSSTATTISRPVVDYEPSAFDRENAVEGVIGIARLCRAAGAREIRPYLPGIEPFIRKDTDDLNTTSDDTAFETWVARIRSVGLSTSILDGGGGLAAYAPFASAHQMGTCRMGDDGHCLDRAAAAGEKIYNYRGITSVVDCRGRVWGTDGLYVADASVFPSASGVNPMVTTMALADWIAQGLAKDLAREKGD